MLCHVNKVDPPISIDFRIILIVVFIHGEREHFSESFFKFKWNIKIAVDL